MAPGTKARVVRLILVKDLRSSDCDECQLMWEALQRFQSTFDDQSLVHVELALDRPVLVRYQGLDRLTIELFVRHSDGSNESSGQLIGSVKEVSTFSGSEACHSLAASWLKDCIENHPTCGVPGPVPLPTRVIDVGSANAGEPRLVESRGLHDNYVALSYCWGDPQVHPRMRTLKTNYDDHMRCIKYSSMPRTIQDAVTICRKLGVQYLWVDALCIIQEDLPDWIEESVKMCSVYTNALCTISAAHADGVSGGIFSKQDFASHTYELNLRGRPIYTRKFLAPYHEHFDFGNIFHCPAATSMVDPSARLTEPIAERGWTLQESILSNRLLHYTTDELMWDCNETRRCECGNSVGASDVSENYNALLRRLDIPVSDVEEWRIWMLWQGFVETFSLRRLSFEPDKLPALAGLAEQYVGHLQQRFGRKPIYLAGLWDVFLLRQICWSVQYSRMSWRPDGKYKPKRPKEWRAPTWSWCSVEAPIKIIEARVFETSAEVIEAVTEPKYPDLYPFGPVKSGRLVLRGMVIKNLKVERTGTDLVLEGPTTNNNDNLLTFKLLDKEGNSLPFLCDDPSSILSGYSLGYLCILIGHRIYGRFPKEPCFLVLRPSDQDANCYERIGLADSRALPVHFMETWDASWAENSCEAEEMVLTIL